MPVKDKPTKEVKCKCGIKTIVDVEPATAYIKTTRFVCKCGRIYHIRDYVNGIITYSIVSKDIDEAYLKQVEEDRIRNRKKCREPMSKFYVYEDEVPKNIRVSTPGDCGECQENSCHDSHCLINTMKKKCFNHCPKCNAITNDIEWGDNNWGENSAWQDATCNICGCEFSEVYNYAYTEIKEK